MSVSATFLKGLIQPLGVAITGRPQAQGSQPEMYIETGAPPPASYASGAVSVVAGAGAALPGVQLPMLFMQTTLLPLPPSPPSASPSPLPPSSTLPLVSVAVSAPQPSPLPLSPPSLSPLPECCNDGNKKLYHSLLQSPGKEQHGLQSGCSRRNTIQARHQTSIILRNLYP
mmetsp:Transcript_26712/g.53667  ORF Transcript_26712/g.53667 Transcript_26712/m.53667 type:complete len:171 (-) Transcript_26712:1472-1984(-)